METDIIKGRKLANLLHQAYITEGVHGETVMPEDLLPAGVEKGSIEHLLFITLTVSIDYMRDSMTLWNNSRLAYEEPDTSYLFKPAEMANVPVAQIKKDMMKYKLCKKPDKDSWIWTTIAVSFNKKYDNDPRNLLKACDYNADRILETLRNGRHINNGQWEWDFPFLRGDKIGPLWVRMLRDNLGYDIQNIELMPIPVDVHIFRATLALGVVHGQYEGNIQELYQYIRQTWFECVKGLKRPDGLNMNALDVDKSLWQLSRNGCTKRQVDGYCPKKANCLCGDYCIPGVIEINTAKSKCRVNT